MDLPHELRILPPHAIDVLLYMGALPDGKADVDSICEGANLSDRAFGKAIRRLVTRNYLSMDFVGLYHLTPEGRRAYQIIAQAQSAGGGRAPAEDDSAPAVTRRLVAVLPRALSIEAPATLYVSVDAPPDGQPPLDAAIPLVLRVEAVNAEIAPAEQTLDVPPDQVALPVAFTLTAPAEGAVRVRVRAYRLTDLDVAAVGGMYFDVDAVDAAQAASAGFQAVGVDLNLQ